jgi:hypothetical protein
MVDELGREKKSQALDNEQGKGQIPTPQGTLLVTRIILIESGSVTNHSA